MKIRWAFKRKISCPECSAEPDSAVGATGQTECLPWGEGASPGPSPGLSSPPCLGCSSLCLAQLLPWGREQENPSPGSTASAARPRHALASLRTFCWVDKMIPQRILRAAATLDCKSAKAQVRLRTRWAVLFLHWGLGGDKPSGLLAWQGSQDAQGESWGKELLIHHSLTFLQQYRFGLGAIKHPRWSEYLCLCGDTLSTDQGVPQRTWTASLTWAAPAVHQPQNCWLTFAFPGTSRIWCDLLQVKWSEVLWDFYLPESLYNSFFLFWS